MARAHAVATVIEETADQQTLGFGPFGLMVVDLLIQLGLDGLEEVLIDKMAGCSPLRTSPLKATSPI